MCNNFNDGLTYFPFSLFCFESCDSIAYTSFFWKWPDICQIFVKLRVGQKQLDHAVLQNPQYMSNVFIMAINFISMHLQPLLPEQ